MITGGIGTRSVASITTSNRTHGIQKGKILERLASGKTGQKIKDSVFITESKSTILQGTTADENNTIAKIDKDIKQLDDIIGVLQKMHEKYTELWNSGWSNAIIGNVPTSDAKKDWHWTNYNTTAPGIIDEINNLLTSKEYSNNFRRITPRVKNRYQVQTFSFKVDGVYNKDISIILPEWSNVAHRYLKLNNIKYVKPGNFGSELQTNANRINHVGSMRYSSRVLNYMKNITDLVKGNFVGIKTDIEEARKLIIDQENQLKTVSDTTVFFNNKSVKMILDDKQRSNRQVEYYNSMMDTLYSAEEIIESNMKSLRALIVEASNGHQNLDEESVRSSLKDEIILKVKSIKNVISSTTFADEELIGYFDKNSDNKLVVRDEIVMTGLLENRKLYLYQTNLYMDQLLETLPNVLDDDKYKIFAADIGENEEDFNEDLLMMYNKDVIVGLIDGVLDNLSNNKSAISDMTAQIANIEYLNNLSTNNINYIVSNIEDIDVQDETIDLMQVEVLENISSEAVMKVKDSARVLMKLIQN